MTMERNDSINPYAPPASSLEGIEVDPSELELAGRGVRLGANILDEVLVGIPTLFLIWLAFTGMGYGFSLFTPITDGPPQILEISVGFLIASGTYLAINGYLLAKGGQSVGKYLCNIRIVRQDGGRATLWDSYVKRHLSMLALGQIPFLGSFIMLIDPLFIFRENRLCLHDNIAGTMVVRTEARMAPALPVQTPAPSVESFCPFCAAKAERGAMQCSDCKRTIYLVDSTTANQSLAVSELLQKAHRLEARRLHTESLDVYLLATRKDPDCKEAWICIRDMSLAPPALQMEARQQIERIDELRANKVQP